MDQHNLKFKYFQKITCPPRFPFGWVINSKLANKCGIWNIDRTAYQPKLNLLNCERPCSANSCKKNFTKQCHTFLSEALRVGYFFEFLIWLLTHLAILHLIVWLCFVCHQARYIMTSSEQRNEIEQLAIATKSLDRFMTIVLTHYASQM